MSEIKTTNDFDLNHPNTVVVVEDLGEAKYVIEWLVSRGVESPPVDLHFPTAISTLSGGRVEEFDRALYYVSFIDFVTRIYCV